MLRIIGNKIYENDREVLLRGVNRAGLEWDANDRLILDSVRYAADEWKANIIRLPVSQDRWFGYMKEQTGENAAEDYRRKVDAIISALAERGKYLLLDLHWSDLGTWCEHSGQHMMPDENSIVFWRDAANRYKNHPNVLFGVYNEPHIDGDWGRSPWDIWKNGGTLAETDKSGKRTEYRAVGMQELVDVIRAEGAKNIAVVGGLDWGYTLNGPAEGYDITDPDGNGIMLDSHVYPWKRLEWDLDVSVSAGLHPILIGECGHYGNDAKPVEGAQCLPSEEWVPRLLDWIDSHGYHLTAWDFHPKAGPCLIRSFDNEPTEYYGAYVRDFLRGHNR